MAELTGGSRAWRFVLLAGLLLVVAAGCDRFRDRCDARGGVVQQQRDRAGDTKARVCTVGGKVVDIVPAVVRPVLVGAHG